MSELETRLGGALTGRYDIERELGQGGMATVYLARDVKHGRRVAVKVLRPDLAEAVGAERFLREIEIAARLQHPHILALINSGEAGGFLYYVMPFAEGEEPSSKRGCRGPSGTDHAKRTMTAMPINSIIHRSGLSAAIRLKMRITAPISGPTFLMSEMGTMANVAFASAVPYATASRNLT